MNRLTSQQRKFAYLAGIILLIIPITLLGMPSTGELGSGGRLAQLRQTYDLGESTLGDVDPSSATMNFVLLGLRGLAANLLWMQHDEHKRTKNWAEMRADTESIIRLQPHFIKVWQYQGWDLAYNVSAEWDDVKDRYQWVKDGSKFLMKGSERNKKSPELPWESGRVFGQKIGRADEWQYFREYFLEDPDPQIEGPDPDINPEGRDNYLVAKVWFERANDAELRALQGAYSMAGSTEEKKGQRIMDRSLFRSYPARSQLDYAAALQRDGIFDEVTRIAWDEAYRDWTQKYGQEIFHTPGGEIRLEMTKEEIEGETGSEQEADQLAEWVNRYQNMTNYRYWRTRALVEAEPQTVAAHRELYEGGQAFKAGELDKAQELLEAGMEKYETMLTRHPELMIEDLAIEEGLMAVLLWQYIHQLKGTTPPEEFALKGLWVQEQNRVPLLDDQFQRQYLR